MASDDKIIQLFKSSNTADIYLGIEFLFMKYPKIRERAKPYMGDNNMPVVFYSEILDIVPFAEKLGNTGVILPEYLNYEYAR